jgi:hypothetical protein
MRTRLALLAVLLPTGLAAQEPLSVIEWLSTPVPPALAGLPSAGEPPVARTALQPDVSVAAIDAAQRPVGLVPGATTGLPVTLWQGSDPETATRLLRDAQVSRSPAMQALLYTLLLTEALPPSSAEEAENLLLAHVDRLLLLGAVDPAQALIEEAGATQSPARFARWFDTTLLTGDEERSCAVLNGAPQLSPDYAARIFCRMRGADYSAAALQFDGARALDLLEPAQVELLDRFLHPDLYEDAPPLPGPTAPDPLTFRLHESIGEPLPTTTLPRAFAHADLRDLAGWKAQLEAAERLARTRALSPNQLLGLYDARLPAASGGIWDRVAALQLFETALETGSGQAVSKTLPSAWQAMRAAHLEVAFADLFAPALAAQRDLDRPSQELAWRIGLLSDGYQAIADEGPSALPEGAFLAALAQGRAGPASDPLEEALAEAFAAPATADDALQARVAELGLGQVLLEAIAGFHAGAHGDLGALARSLQQLRALGFEDTARRAALQLVLLEPR